MAIKASHFVSVDMSSVGQYPEKAGFGELAAITQETGAISRAERIRHYSDVDSVITDFGANAEVSKVATSYYSQQPKPKKFAVAMRYETDQVAELITGVSNIIAEWNAIVDGSFTIEIDGFSASIGTMDFTTDVNMDAVAARIQASIIATVTAGVVNANLITVTHDGNKFTIKSPNAGSSGTISFLTAPSSGTDISSLMKGQQGQAVIAQGIDAETITASLSAIEDRDPDWYGFMFTKEVRDNVIINGESAVIAAAIWANARVKRFFNTTNDLAVIDPASISNIARSIADAGYGRTMTTFSSYPDLYPSASMAARAFTVNFEQANSAMTLNLKDAPGITGEDLTTSQLGAMQANRCNAIIQIGSQKKFTDSRMGDGKFFDEGHGIDWLVNSMEVEVYGYLSTIENKVAYTDPGTVSIEQRMDKVLAQAVRNGLGAPGETTDGEFLSRGYKITMAPVSEVSQSLVDARTYVGASFVLIGAGAIHRVEIKGLFV